MKETGIIMSGDHPKKIMDGIKTMTRRTYGLNQINKHPDSWQGLYDNLSGYATFYDKAFTDAPPMVIKCHYGHIGDRLWVKETWFNNAFSFVKPDIDNVLYRADGEFYDQVEDYLEGRWKPSIFMPRWASRIILEITEVRVERLQSITEEDALAEGIEVTQGTWQAMEKDKDTGRLKLVGEPHPYTARYHFEALWDYLNSKRGYGWSINPWVWVISFGGVGIKVK